MTTTPTNPHDITSEETLQDAFMRKLAIKKADNRWITYILRNTIADNPRLKRYAERVAHKIDACALSVALDVHKDHVRVANATFCRERLCGVCAWRRQAKFIATTYPALSVLAADGYRFLFVTLTIKNVKYDGLKTAVDTLLDGWLRFTRKTAVKKVLKGYVRSFEVTYNRERNDYHPHIHAILVVGGDYFAPNNPDWLSQADICRLWQEAARLNYKPVVDIRALEERDEKKPYIEVMKYALKPSDAPAKDLLELALVLKGRRLVCFGGIVAKLRSLDLDDLTDRDIDEPAGKQTPLRTVLYYFNVSGGVYEIVKSVGGE